LLNALRENTSLASTGVDQQAERQRKIGFFTEIADRLGTSVFFQPEIVFYKIGNNLALFVADRSQESDDFNINGDGGLLKGTHWIIRQQKADGDQAEAECERT
jgi:hypothetical protein